MRSTLHLLAGLILALSLTASATAQVKTPPEAIQRFTDARFGMFIHFGLYSIPAGVWNGEQMGRNWYAEWMQKQGNWPYGISDKEYQALAKQFNPTEFDAEEWVLEAKNAGMKYIVITSKHHDGFALWPSDVSKYDVQDASPFKRDILGELKAACDKHGIGLGFYYSHWQDWEHPGGARPPAKEFKSEPLPVQPTQEQFEKYWQEKCLPQVRELIKRYDPMLLWFDTWTTSEFITEERTRELIQTVKNLSPECLVNSRIAMKMPGVENMVDFLSMGDNSFPKTRIDKPWETPATMNHSWGYHQLDYNWKPTSELLVNLARNASYGGNYQLNIGPMGNGAFPKASVRRLREMGAWLSANQEGIYGAAPNPLPEQDWGFITTRTLPGDKTRLYLHVAKWPANEQILVRGLNYMPASIRVLESGQPLTFEPREAGIIVHVPKTPIDQNITVIQIDLKERLRPMVQ